MVFALFVSSAPVLTLPSFPAPQAPPPLPVSEERTFALETLNGFRTLHGLQPVTFDRRLNDSAAQHVRTMSRSASLTHKGPTKDLETPYQRAQSHGFSEPIAELVGTGIASAPQAVVSFMDSPYHRRLLLKPGRLAFGCAAQGGYVCFVVGGQAENATVLSPPHGSVNVPTQWDGRSSPNPMRGSGGSGPYGYPIVVTSYGHGGEFRYRGGSLTDGTGRAVPMTVLHPDNDPHLTDSIILIPREPLSPAVRYTVTLQSKVAGDSMKQSWSFVTKAAPRTSGILKPATSRRS